MGLLKSFVLLQSRSSKSKFFDETQVIAKMPTTALLTIKQLVPGDFWLGIYIYFDSCLCRSGVRFSLFLWKFWRRHLGRNNTESTVFVLPVACRCRTDKPQIPAPCAGSAPRCRLRADPSRGNAGPEFAPQWWPRWPDFVVKSDLHICDAPRNQMYWQ